MRVLYWTEQFWPYPGGTEVLGAQLVGGLRARGHEFRVVASHGSLPLADEERCGDIPVHRFPFLPALTRRDLRALQALRRRVATLKRAFAPDLVHLHTVGPTAFFHLRTADASPVPVLLTPHAPLTTQETGDATLLGQLFRSASWVTTVSRAALEAARRLAPEITACSSVVYNGLAAPALPPAPLPANPPRLLCLGRLVRDKGFDLALMALAALRPRYPRLRLAIAGDGPVRPDLERQAVALGIAEGVDFLGLVPAVAPVINAATLVVMPSRWEETFGLVALEAAQLARPVVATRVGGLPEVVRHEETGLVVDKDDPHALAEAIALLLERPDAAVRMGQAARTRALREFSLTRCVDAYDDLYRRLAQDYPA